MPIKQLLLCKYLFKKADDSLKDVNSFSAGLAISLFQDAVELLLWTIIKEYSVSVKDKDSFDKLWDSVNTIKREGKDLELSHRARIIELNKARVNFKHYGILPAASEADKFRDYVEDFIELTCSDYLNIVFKEVSLADVIKNNEARDKIKEAESYLIAGDIIKSIISCSHAGYLVFNSFDKLLPMVDNNFKNASELFDRESYHRANDFFRYLGDYLNALRDCNIVALLDMNLADYLRFRNIIPYVSRYRDGDFQTTMRVHKPSHEDVVFCIKFVIDCALAAEEKLQ